MPCKDSQNACITFLSGLLQNQTCLVSYSNHLFGNFKIREVFILLHRSQLVIITCSTHSTPINLGDGYRAVQFFGLHSTV